MIAAGAAIQVSQTLLHPGIFGVEFQNFAIDVDGGAGIPGAQVQLGQRGILRARIAKKALRAVEFGQLQHAIAGAGAKLGHLLVHGDGLDHEPVGGIGVGDFAEALQAVVETAHANIEVTDRVHHGEVAGIAFQDLFVLGDGILQLALQHKALRCLQDLRLVKAKS